MFSETTLLQFTLAQRFITFLLWLILVEVSRSKIELKYRNKLIFVAILLEQCFIKRRYEYQLVIQTSVSLMLAVLSPIFGLGKWAGITLIIAIVGNLFIMTILSNVAVIRNLVPMIPLFVVLVYLHHVMFSLGTPMQKNY